MIESKYIITKETVALFPVKHIDYNTVIIESAQTKYIKQTPLEIIKTSCFNYWSTYEGRRAAVVHHMAFKQKVPIPVSIQKAICLFPTHAPTHFENNWIAYEHIDRFHRITQQNHKHPAQIYVTFKNGYTTILNVSLHIFKTQWQRTFNLMYKIGMIDLQK